jgi:L-2-hydroxyglutarate oxidase LhgO
VARAIDGLNPATIPPRHMCKGTYFSAAGAHRFRHLIYPVPASASLGIHLTVDLGGQVRFGPDQEWVDDVDYGLDEARAAAFYDTIRRYYPGLPEGTLQPTYAGVRPKIQGPDDPMTDFAILGARDHGIPRLVNLFGIESPGLTSSLALADEVVARLDDA